MKLIFSILLTFLLRNSCAQARDVVVIEYIKNIESALVTKKILINTFQFPDHFIHIYKQETSCSNKTSAIVQLCILENGELEIRKINQYVLKNSFGIFLDKNEMSATKE
jgi:hypothetical protein